MLDVRDVTHVDRNAIPSLIAANHFANALGRRLVLIVDNGPVTKHLDKAHVSAGFRIIQDHRDEAPAS
jgi:anti-anti-sigma regulatory factor